MNNILFMGFTPKFIVRIHSSAQDMVVNFAKLELEKYLKLLDETLKNDSQKQLLRSLEFYFGQNPPKYSIDVSKKLDEYQNSMQNDSYLIDSTQSNIYILGKSSRAILFAVYHFLQYIGIRWYFPGQRFEEIPNHLKVKSIAIHHVQIPHFTRRGILVNGKPKNLLNWIDYAAKHRLNWVAVDSIQWFDRLQLEANRRGLDFDAMLPTLGNKFCTQSRIEFDSAETQVLDLNNKMPISNKKLYCIQPEKYISRCRCRGDKVNRVSGTILHRLNLLINNPKLYHQKRLAFRAQLSTWNFPPVTLPHPDVFLQLAPIHRCYAHSFNDTFCQVNRSYVSPTMNQLLRIFKPKDTEVLEYWLDATLFGNREFEIFGWAYRPGAGRIPHIPRLIKKDLDGYAALGISQIIVSARGLDEEYFKRFTSPTVLFYPQLIWDPKSDLKHLLQTFCAEYFESDQSGKFFDENELIDPKDITNTQFQGIMDLTTKRIKLLQQEIDQAKSSRIKNRIRLMLEEQQSKLIWNGNFFAARLKAIFNILWFRIQLWRS